MARPDQNPKHQADKEKADDVSNPDKISYPRRELPIIAPKFGCPKQSEKQEQIRKNCTRFEKNRVSFHITPPTIYKAGWLTLSGSITARLRRQLVLFKANLTTR